MRDLNAGRVASNSGNCASLVVFLHGYGANGQDLLGLAAPLGEHMPDTVFLAPDAPNVCGGNPLGFEWFPIPWLDGSSEKIANVEMAKSLDDLSAWLDKVMAEEGVTPAQTVLLGFSQGTMMSLHLAPRRDAPFACVVGFSGRLLQPEKLAEEVVSKFPILLVHGDQDEMVPPASMPQAAEALTAAGFEVRTHISPGTAHGIAPDGLGLALQFMVGNLST